LVFLDETTCHLHTIYTDVILKCFRHFQPTYEPANYPHFESIIIGVKLYKITINEAFEVSAEVQALTHSLIIKAWETR